MTRMLLTYFLLNQLSPLLFKFGSMCGAFHGPLSITHTRGRTFSEWCYIQIFCVTNLGYSHSPQLCCSDVIKAYLRSGSILPNRLRLLLKYLERGQVPVKITDLRRTLSYAAKVLTFCSVLINSERRRYPTIYHSYYNHKVMWYEWSLRHYLHFITHLSHSHWHILSHSHIHFNE